MMMNNGVHEVMTVGNHAVLMFSYGGLSLVAVDENGERTMSNAPCRPWVGAPRKLARTLLVRLTANATGVLRDVGMVEEDVRATIDALTVVLGP